MHERQRRILKTLYQNQTFMTYQRLAQMEDVSVKTVRNDIEAIRGFLAERQTDGLETKPGYGVMLSISEEAWQRLGGEENAEEKKIFFFILRHLFRDDVLTAQRLSEQYYLGRSQLDKILQKVSDWLEKRQIVLERKKGKGLSIRYSEFHFRLAFWDFYTEFGTQYADLMHQREARYAPLPAGEYTAICAALDGFEADLTAKAMLDTENEFGIRWNLYSGTQLLFLASLGIVRARKGHTVTVPKAEKTPVDGTSDEAMAKSLVQHLTESIGDSIADEEYDYMVFLIAIAEIQQFEDDASRRNFELQNAALCRMTVRAVNLIGDITGVSLLEDRFFVHLMMIQLKASIARLRFGILFPNQLLPQIKEKYPNMMAAAQLLGNIFENELHLIINEHEAGFIALHIGGALERRIISLSACIVCEYGIGISRILEEKIARSFPELRITNVFSVREMQKIKSEPCDFIISTISLSAYQLHRDVIEVGHLLDERDVDKLKRYIKTLRLSRKETMRHLTPNAELFRKELLFLRCEVFSKEVLLKTLCKKLENMGYVTAQFEASVLEREHSMATDIGKGIAIPHGLGEYVNRSTAVFVSLKEPIAWNENGDKVDMLFLLAFDFEEDEKVKERIIGFYKSMVAFMENESECEKLKKLTKEEEVLKILRLW